MSELTVREAAAADVEVLTSLIGELGYDATRSQVAERLVRHQRSDRDVVLVADDGGRVVGLVVVNLVPMFIWVGDVSHIAALCVAADVRGRGVGRALVAAAERWAAGRGSELMQVNCGRRAERDGAHHLYQALGYSDQHSHHVLYERRLTGHRRR